MSVVFPTMCKPLFCDACMYLENSADLWCRCGDFTANNLSELNAKCPAKLVVQKTINGQIYWKEIQR